MGYPTEAAPRHRPEAAVVSGPGGGEHVIEWQPKFARDASALAASVPDDGLDLTGLVSALGRQPTSGTPRSYRVAEFTQAADPGQTAVADYLRRAPDGGPAELWVLGASAGQTQRLSEAFDDGAAGLDGPRWAIAGEGSLGNLWADQAARGARRIAPRLGDVGWLWSGEAHREMRALRAIDFFGDFPGPSSECGDDPLGTQLVTRFLALLRALAAARQACTPCRLTVITRRAALGAWAPREALLWGAARALGRELDPALRVDVRLVDVGGPADLPMLRWLARHDVREHALAVRKGRLHAPCLVRRPGAPGTVATSD
jgi:hypothetical protein